MSFVEVTIQTGFESDKTLLFRVYDTNIALKWAQLLANSLEKNPTIQEDDRFYGFPGDIRNGDKWIVDKLNECIGILNSHHSGAVPFRVQLPLDQEEMNRVHTFFEKFSGPSNPNRKYFEEAPEDVLNALRDLNVTIHRREFDDLNRNRPKSQSGARFVVSFNENQRYDLAEKDYQYFSLKRMFGEVYLKYCLVGKTLWDMCKDDDSVANDDNIRPQNQYNPDFYVSLFPSDTDSSLERRLEVFETWWKKNEVRLNSLNFYRGDPRCAIGSIPVARLVHHEYIEPRRLDFLSEFREPLKLLKVRVL